MDRLYAGGSSLDGGTLLQLINRCDVARNVTGRFNSTIDYMETVVDCHITAAAMDYFGMNKVTDEPSENVYFLHGDSLDAAQKWDVLQKVVGRLSTDTYSVMHRVLFNLPHHPLKIHSGYFVSYINVYSGCVCIEILVSHRSIALYGRCVNIL